MIYLVSIEGDTLVTYPYEGFFTFNDEDYFIKLAAVLGASKLYHNNRMVEAKITPRKRFIKTTGLLEVSPYLWIGGDIAEDARLMVGFVNNTPIVKNLVEDPKGLLIPLGVSAWYDDTGIVQATNHPASMSKSGDIYGSVPVKADMFLVGNNKYLLGRYKGIASIAPIVALVTDKDIVELTRSLGDYRIILPIPFAEMVEFPGYVNEDGKTFTMFILDLMVEEEKGVFYGEYVEKGDTSKLGVGYDTNTRTVLTCRE